MATTDILYPKRKETTYLHNQEGLYKNTVFIVTRVWVGNEQEEADGSPNPKKDETERDEDDFLVKVLCCFQGEA